MVMIMVVVVMMIMLMVVSWLVHGSPTAVNQREANPDHEQAGGDTQPGVKLFRQDELGGEEDDEAEQEKPGGVGDGGG